MWEIKHSWGLTSHVNSSRRDMSCHAWLINSKSWRDLWLEMHLQRKEIWPTMAWQCQLVVPTSMPCQLLPRFGATRSRDKPSQESNCFLCRTARAWRFAGPQLASSKTVWFLLASTMLIIKLYLSCHIWYHSILNTRGYLWVLQGSFLSGTVYAHC